eukprot:EG_transcript_12278
MEVGQDGAQGAGWRAEGGTAPICRGKAVASSSATPRRRPANTQCHFSNVSFGQLLTTCFASSIEPSEAVVTGLNETVACLEPSLACVLREDGRAVAGGRGANEIFPAAAALAASTTAPPFIREPTIHVSISAWP